MVNAKQRNTTYSPNTAVYSTDQKYVNANKMR